MVISYSCSASTKLTWILVLLLILVTMIRVHGQPTPGFLSIDCGLTNSSAYNDSTTKILYQSDNEFVEGGMSYKISAEFMADATNEQQKNLRSFPNGPRNCYTLPSTAGKKFLLRATFTYGNYDGLNKTQDGSLFLFGLHIGVNFWESVNLTNGNPSLTVWKEVLTIAPGSFMSVCLINFGSGTPFVSALELRPLEDTMYPFLSPSVSVSYFTRIRFGRVNEPVLPFCFDGSYPVDPYDRFWENWLRNSGPWLPLNTSEPVSRLPGSDDFQVPSAILQQASTIRSDFTWLNVTVRVGPNLDAKSLELLPIFHFAEIGNGSSRRTFDIYSDGELLFPKFSPSLLRVDSMHQNGRFLRNANTSFTLRSVPNSTLPPLINAFELYSLVRMDNFTTASDDGKISDILTHPAGRRPSVVGRREKFLDS